MPMSKNKETEFYILKVGNKHTRLFWILFSFHDMAFEQCISQHTKSIKAIRKEADKITSIEFDKIVSKLSKKKNRLHNLLMEYVAIAKLAAG